MANRIPLVVDTSDGNKLKELPLGDNLDLTGSSLINATSVQTQTLSIAGTAFSGSYTELSNKPTIPADISDLTDTQGLLGQGGGGSTYNVTGDGGLLLAADDSVQKFILPGNTLKIQGAGSVTTTLTEENGTDVLTISHPLQDANTTYTFNAISSGSNKVLQLVDSNSAIQNVTLVPGTNIGISLSAQNQLTFSATDTNTTYNIDSVIDGDGDLALRLSGSTGATDDIKITAGSNISITRNSDSEFTIANTQTLPNTFGQIVVGATTLTAGSTADDFNLSAGTGIQLSANSGTNTITITNTAPDQNLFQTVAGDTGSRVAQSTTDQLNIVGGADISTAILGNTLTINYTGGAGGSANMFQYVAVGTPVSNVQLVADSPNDIMYVTGGTGISLTASGTGGGVTVDQLTITNSAPNVDQNIWATVSADTGSTTANTTTDTLSIVGGTDISTSITGDVLTINYTGTGGGITNFNDADNYAFKTVALSPSGGSVVADSNIDTLTLASGNQISMSANSSTDTITINVVAAGSTNQVQYNNNGNLGGNANFTFDNITNTLSVTNIQTNSIQPPSNLVGTYTIASPTTITLDPVDEIINDAPMKLVNKTVTQLSTLVASIGSMVYCTNESGGAIPAFYDGTNWRRVSDRNIVS